MRQFRSQPTMYYLAASSNFFNATFLFGHVINILSYGQTYMYGWSLLENLALGHWYRPHCIWSVLRTSVKILPYRPPARAIGESCPGSLVQTSLHLVCTVDLGQDSPIHTSSSVNKNIIIGKLLSKGYNSNFLNGEAYHQIIMLQIKEQIQILAIIFLEWNRPSGKIFAWKGLRDQHCGMQYNAPKTEILRNWMAGRTVEWWSNVVRGCAFQVLHDILW